MGEGEGGAWLVVADYAVKNEGEIQFYSAIRGLVLLNIFRRLRGSVYSFGLGTYFANESDELRILACGGTKRAPTDSFRLHPIAIPRPRSEQGGPIVC